MDATAARSGIYARSKEAGEKVVISLLAGRFFVARTAWLYNNGGNNYIAKIVAAADKQGALRVVADEFGNPTYAPDLADAIARLIDVQHYGIYHLTNSGYCTRHEWALEICARRAGDVPVTPVLRGNGRDADPASAHNSAQDYGRGPGHCPGRGKKDWRPILPMANCPLPRSSSPTTTASCCWRLAWTRCAGRLFG